MKLFISPHNDDEALFGAFTIIRERPLVLIVTDSARQASKGITAEQRRLESQNALRILGAPIAFLGIPDQALEAFDLDTKLSLFLEDFGPFTHVYFPGFEKDGNVDHNLISTVAARKFAGSSTRYLTYTKAGKSRSATRVDFSPPWIQTKLKALACYRSQILEPSTLDHFLRDQYEYYE